MIPYHFYQIFERKPIMLFSSIEFLYYFLPITIIGYFLLPKQLRNGWLLAVSLVFYAWASRSW